MSFDDIADEVRVIAQQCAWDILNRVGDERYFHGQSLAHVTRLIVSEGVTINQHHVLIDLFYAECHREIERHCPPIETIDVSYLERIPKAS